MPKEPLRQIIVPAGFTIADFGKGRGGGYQIDSQKADGVTSVLGIIDGGKSGGMAWSAARIWTAGICSIGVDEPWAVNFHSPEEIEAELKSRKLLHIHKWGDKADLGTSVHDVLESLCAGDVPPLPDDESRPYMQAICSWFADNDPEVVFTELMVASKLHGYAGRFDLLYRQHDQLVLADLKTSKSVQPTHLIQLAAYALAMEECGYGKPDRMEVIWAKPDGSYTVVPSTSTPEQFLAILDAYRAYGAAKNELKAAA